jgi:hypothetical protein
VAGHQSVTDTDGGIHERENESGGLCPGHAGSRAFVGTQEAGPLHQVKVLKTPWFCVVISRPSGLWGVSVLMLPPLWVLVVGVVLYLLL